LLSISFIAALALVGGRCFAGEIQFSYQQITSTAAFTPNNREQPL
jgi:hypothetical protein